MANNITNLMLKGVGIGTHGALVLCDLLSRENGGLNSLKTAALISSLPLILVYFMMAASLLISFKKYGVK